MNSLSEVQKKRIFNLLEKISHDISIFKKAQVLKGKEDKLSPLRTRRVLLDRYRRFKSPRKFFGVLIDSIKNKFYYETEHFVGDVFAQQEQFNNRVIDYLEVLEKELKVLKKEIFKKDAKNKKSQNIKKSKKK
ncbi:hypothetical protein KKD70_05320 [Patescibacteria group bacterium]|nr:hypothetical protein [Patescibacteria group bacterium]